MKQIDSEKKLDRLKIDELLKTIYSNNTTEEINYISNQLLQILDNFSAKSANEEIIEVLTLFCTSIRKWTFNKG